MAVENCQQPLKSIGFLNWKVRCANPNNTLSCIPFFFPFRNSERCGLHQGVSAATGQTAPSSQQRSQISYGAFLPSLPPPTHQGGQVPAH